MAPPQSDAFQKAVVDSQKLTSKPGNDDLLELYALYKVALGESFDAATKPGMFDLKGKAKYNAWSALNDQALTPEQAQEKYVAKVEKLKEEFGYDANKTPESVGGK